MGYSADSDEWPTLNQLKNVPDIPEQWRNTIEHNTNTNMATTSTLSCSNTGTSNEEGKDEIVVIECKPGGISEEGAEGEGATNTDSGTGERIGLGGRRGNGRKRTLGAFM
jgi:hypothetical protein